MQERFRFTGHETFHCRSYWLKKGYDQITAGKAFGPEATIDLGVGKNMVSSIKYWMKSFNIIDQENEKINLISTSLFQDDGWDPYLEDVATLWLLHYTIVKNNYASIFHLIFNELRKKKPKFTFRNFEDLIKDKDIKTSSNSLKSDFQSFVRTYLSKGKTKDLEDSFSGILTELNLLNEKSSGAYEITPDNRLSIPLPIFLYCILDSNNDVNSIGFESLYTESNSIGSIFALSRDGLHELLENLADSHSDIVYSNEAGIRELQFKKKFDPIKVLEDYYAK